MRILVDENMLPQFRRNFPEHEVRSAQFLGWLGRHNGELVRLGQKPCTKRQGFFFCKHEEQSLHPTPAG